MHQFWCIAMRSFGRISFFLMVLVFFFYGSQHYSVLLAISLAGIIWLFQKLYSPLKSWYLQGCFGEWAIGCKEFHNWLEQSTSCKVQCFDAKSQLYLDESSEIKFILDQPCNLRIIKNCFQYNWSQGYNHSLVFNGQAWHLWDLTSPNKTKNRQIIKISKET